MTGQDPGVACRSFWGLALWALGYPDRAREQSDAALALAQSVAHPFSVAYALTYRANLTGHGGDWAATQQQAEALIELTTEQAFPVWFAMGQSCRGWAVARQGRLEEGIGQMRQGLGAYRATGNRTFQPRVLAQLAEAYAQAGQVTDGLRVLDEALEEVAQTGEREYEAELYRLKGELTLQTIVQEPKSHVEAEAEKSLLTASDLARGQAAKSWELRAVTSLARLWRQQGKRTAAHSLLAPVYGWFTEGFDTKDLQEAKTLLEKLH